MAKMVITQKTQKAEKKIKARDDAFSPVIGEILLIALILILIPSVTISLMHQLPQDRIPTVNILMQSDSSGVSLYHKGRDYINIDDIDIFVQDVNIGNAWKTTYKRLNNKILFDLGDVITIPANPGNKITLVTQKAVIFRGVVPP